MNPDIDFNLTATQPATTPLVGSVGVVSSEGLGRAFFTVPALAAPSLAGRVVHHVPWSSTRPLRPSRW